MTYFVSPSVSDKHASTLPVPSSPGSPANTKGKNAWKPTSHRSISLGGWVKNLFPAQRPERGGTEREHGYWEQIESSPSAEQPTPSRRRRLTDSHQSRAESDILTRWNTPKDLPTPPVQNPTRPSGRQWLSKTSHPDFHDTSDRKWSWAPEAGNQRKSATRTSDNAANKDTWVELGLHDIPKISSGSKDQSELSRAALVADRRLLSTKQAIESKKEIRRQRRSLKESGDYLGVQGVNPETRELDMISSTNSEKSMASHRTADRVDALQHALKEARARHKNSPLLRKRETKKILLKMKREKLRRDQKINREFEPQQPIVKWRRHTKQWSSAQEPRLSPVTQSQRSSMQASTLLPTSEATKDQQLLDLSTGQNAIHLEPKEDPVDTSGGTSKSSGTVVHTPHRQSQSFITPAALELFENGIIFDEEQRSKTKQKRNSGRQEKGKKAAPDPRDSSKEEPGNINIADRGSPLPTPAIIEALLNSSKDKSDTKESSSFLGVRAQRRFSVTPESLRTNHPDETLIFQSSMKHRTRRLSQTDPLPLGTTTESFEPDSLKTSRSSDIIGQTGAANLADREKHLQSRGSPFQKLSKRFLRELSHLGIERENIRTSVKRAVSEHALRSVANLDLSPEASTPFSIDQDIQPSPPNSLEEMGTVDAVTTKKQSQPPGIISSQGVQVGDLTLISTPGKGESSDYLTNQQKWMIWSDKVVGSINEKSEEVKRGAACTHTTTTIGYDRLTSVSPQKSEEVSQVVDSEEIHATNPRDSSEISSPGFMSSPLNNTQSTSRSLELGKGPETDTTFMAGLVQDQTVPSTALSDTLEMNVPLDQDPQYIKLQMSLSTAEKAENRVKGEMSKKATELSGPTQSHLQRNAPLRPLAEITTNRDGENQSTKQSTYLMDNITRAETSQMELTRAQYPGAYPFHQDADDDIAALFGSILERGRIEHLLPTRTCIDNCWRNTVALPVMLYDTLRALLRLYVEHILVPFLNYSPGISKTVRQTQPALRSRVIIALGLPGALLMALAFS